MVAVVSAGVLGDQGDVARGVRCRCVVVGWSVLTMKKQTLVKEVDRKLVLASLEIALSSVRQMEAQLKFQHWFLVLAFAWAASALGAFVWIMTK